jgi:predicted ATPase
MGATTLEAFALVSLAQARLNLGEFDEAMAHVREARATIEATGVRAVEAEALRIEAEIVALRDVSAAENGLLAAVSVAARQKAKAWELRAATSLARLLRDQGRRSEARALLAPILDWFAEGLETGDLSAASTLMKELAQSHPRDS